MPDPRDFVLPPCPVMPTPPRLVRLGDPVGGVAAVTPVDAALSAGLAGDAFGGTNRSLLELASAELGSVGAKRTVALTPAALERSIPTLSQRVIDLLAQHGPALDVALTTLALDSDSRQSESASAQASPSVYAQEAGSTPSVTVRVDRLPPVVFGALKPPVEPLVIEPARLAKWPPPPLSESLEVVLAPHAQAYSAPPEDVAVRTPVLVSLSQVLDHVRALDAFLGVVLDRWIEAVSGPLASPASSPTRRLGRLGLETLRKEAVASSLVALYGVYAEYKGDYYGLVQGRRAHLDRRDPNDSAPVASEEDIDHFLTLKHGAAMRMAMWKLAKAAAIALAGKLLGADQPWYSMGSLHERIGDGRYANNQLEGLYIALRSDRGDLEVQKLQGRNPSGLNPYAIYNRALAVRLGPDVVAYDARNDELTLNDRPLAWRPGTVPLPGGATLVIQPDALTFVSNSGDGIVVTRNDGALDLAGVVSGRRPIGSVAGSLGSFDGATSELVGSDGRTYSEAEYEAFLATWQPTRYERLLG